MVEICFFHVKGMQLNAAANLGGKMQCSSLQCLIGCEGQVCAVYCVNLE